MSRFIFTGNQNRMKETGAHDAISWFYVAIHFLFAFVAGSMRKLNDVQSQKFSFSGLISSGAISSFAGVITYLICDYFGLDWRLSAAFTGVAGWFGGNWMNFLGLFSKKVIGNVSGVNITPEDEAKHRDALNK